MNAEAAELRKVVSDLEREKETAISEKEVRPLPTPIHLCRRLNRPGSDRDRFSLALGCPYPQPATLDKKMGDRSIQSSSWLSRPPPANLPLMHLCPPTPHGCWHGTPLFSSLEFRSREHGRRFS